MKNTTPILFCTALMRINDLPFIAHNIVDTYNNVKDKIKKDFNIDGIPFTWVIVRVNKIAYGDPYCIKPTLDYLNENGIDFRYYEYNEEQKYIWDSSPINSGICTYMMEHKEDNYNPFFMLLDDDNILNEQMFYDYAEYNARECKQDIIYYDMLHEGNRLWCNDSVMMEKKLTSNYYWDYVADPSQTMIRLSTMKRTNYIRPIQAYRKLLNRYVLQNHSYLSGFDLEKYYKDVEYLMNFVAYDISYYTPLLIMEFMNDNVYFVGDSDKRQALSHEMNKSVSTYHNGLKALTSDSIEKINLNVTNENVLNSTLMISALDNHDTPRVLKLDTGLAKEVWNLVYKYYTEKNDKIATDLFPEHENIEHLKP